MIYTKKNGVAFHWKSFQLKSKKNENMFIDEIVFWVAKKNSPSGGGTVEQVGDQQSSVIFIIC